MVAKVALDGAVITNALYSSVIGAALITMLLLPSYLEEPPPFSIRSWQGCPSASMPLLTGSKASAWPPWKE